MTGCTSPDLSLHEVDERPEMVSHMSPSASNVSLGSLAGQGGLNISRRPSTTAALLKNPARDEDMAKSYGSVNRESQQTLEIVARHLVQSPNNLQLQSGDITRDLYRWTQDHPVPLQSGDLVQPVPQRRRRSMSFSGVSIHSSTNQSFLQQGEQLPQTAMSHEEITAPGGFRRSFLLQQHQQRYGDDAPPPNFFTRNFIEFLALYGHFAGEDLEEEEVEEVERWEARDRDDETVLLDRRERESKRHKASTFKAVLLLLKSFIGTGVLFLPKAFDNGGWAFSAVCLLVCAVASFMCFVSLIATKDMVGVNGYGDLGLRLFGPKMKFMILLSIALSQIGFSAAYVVFTATNLKVFCENVLGVYRDAVGLAGYILFQTLLFIPLALTRNIAKLSGTTLVADVFILLGLIYVYYYPSYYIFKHGIASESMQTFNKSDWSLFVGTAIFTFEGIGLLIPIQESMEKPALFNKCLLGVMGAVTLLFISSALLCYAAFGSKVEVVVLLNFPQDSAFTKSSQLLYALAILLSTPLQLFPAIRILENWSFPTNASGKHNPRIKWLKNYFRAAIVILTSLVAWIGANDLDKFVSLVGSVACVPLIYVYPPLLHFKAFKDRGASKLSLVADLSIAAIGILIMIYNSYQSTLMWGS
ncbi:hypothetical protein HG536_0E03850 [Torulaspora globosa]|uniref:Amino acid transporter transmembrane domain-containing protein n=1 Tax=Torulaspora globosa TaxID=48254 RepID=A0A7G3ZIY8_9SACH|nr:uncharacterized protein HG536_0E03850 [Torulaspora globosa]QLL33474.1 hypothetical protein HG536_0E03850 [Torulaspora globosa]